MIGVNWALHEAANEKRQRREDSMMGEAEGSSFLLRGILKGCAEQNALGALAARGVPYTAVRTLHVLSLPTVEEHRAPSPLGTPHRPCQACQRYLSLVGQECVRVHGRPVVLHIASDVGLKSIDTLTFS